MLDLVSSREITYLEVLLRIGVAVFVGSVIGIEREYKNRPAGMRTHVLVCLGSCMVALMECIFSASLGVQTDSHITYSFGRMTAQVLSGIGFLGAGTIFTAQKKITGLTTAASLWNVACLGIASGYGYYSLAFFGCVIVIVVLLLFQRIIHVNVLKRVEIEFSKRSETLLYINTYFEEQGIKVLDVDFHIETLLDAKNNEKNVYTNLYTLHLPSKLSYTDIVNKLSEYPYIQTVRTRNT